MGISFIEILIVLLLTSTILSFVIPSFFNKGIKSQKQTFISQFNTLVQESLMQAVINGKVYQIFFDFDQHLIIPKIHDLSLPPTNQHQQFSPLPKGAIPEPITLPAHFAVRNFFINGVDEFGSGRTMKTAWFYIMPDGTSQAIIINIESLEDTASKQYTFSLVINPFYSQVKEYDTFQKP